MDKILTLLLTIAVAFSALSVSVSATKTTTSSADCKSVIDDRNDIFDSDERTRLCQLLNLAGSEAGCNIGVIISDNIVGEPGQAADDFLDKEFGKNSDSMVLLLTTAEGKFDYLTMSGKAYDRYFSQIDLIYEAVYDGMIYGYSRAIENFCGYFGADVPKTEASYSVKLTDLDNRLSDTEISRLIDTMQETADAVKCNVGAVITADLNGKSESEYADDFADDSFGYGSDNVVLLLCNDHIHTDWISAYGRGTDLFGKRTDDLFDYVYDGLGEDDYYEAVNYFCKGLKKYGANVGDDYYYDYDDDYSYDGSTEDFIENLLIVGFVPLIIAGVITAAIVVNVRKGYTKKKPVSARVYLNSERKKFLRRNDTFVNEYTTSVSVNSSSGGGGRRGGGGGRSRSGRSGGGGRRR